MPLTSIFYFITWRSYRTKLKILKPQSITCRLFCEQNPNKMQYYSSRMMTKKNPHPTIDYYKSATNKLESIRKEKFLKGEK